MIKAVIMMDLNNPDRMNDRDSKLGLKGAAGKGETHMFFLQVADNFISTFRVSSVVCVLFSTDLIEEAAVWVAQQLSALSWSIRRLALESAAVTL